MIKLVHAKKLSNSIIALEADLSNPLLLNYIGKEGLNFLKGQLKADCQVAQLITSAQTVFIVKKIIESNDAERIEAYRRTGVVLCGKVKELKLTTISFFSEQNTKEVLALAEGLALSNYQFAKYKKQEQSLKSLEFYSTGNILLKLTELETLLKAVYKTRDLVNEPVVFLTAEQLSKEIETLGKEAGFKTEVLNKSKIRSLKMGGLLAVNLGSPNPPTFNILEYKPKNAVNKKPIVLVGKGVVYDTGGLSLKPTEQSMDIMKCDMAGAASVIGAFYAVAKSKLPVHIIGLIPATENRPGGNAITPGDIITMHDGKTVEIMNTDAEGRLILADALSYAKKYNPELVIDLATLTGSAVRAIGKEAIVYMGTAVPKVKKDLELASWEVFERVVEFPLWKDYDAHIQSDIADLKNLGTSEAGAISAGKFLEHFTDYPWLHLDIAGGSFMTSPHHYWVKGGTGLGVKLLYTYLKTRINQ